MPVEIAGEGRTGFAGRVLYVPLRVDADVAEWLPAGLTPAGGNTVYLECYRMKRRVIGADGEIRRPDSIALSQYEQICLTVLVDCDGFGIRKHNLFMWEDLDVALLVDRGFGWVSRPAEIRQTVLVASENDFDYPGSEHLYDVNAWRHRALVLQVAARLDAPPSELAMVDVTSFYSVFSDARGVRIYGVDYLDPWNSHVASGPAELMVNIPAANEEMVPLERTILLTLAGAVPLGASLFDVAWSRSPGDVRLERTQSLAGAQ